jgi:hypothetical protein
MGFSRDGPNVDERWLMAGSPAGQRNQPYDQIDINADLVASLTTQTMTTVAVPCQPGDLITSISFLTGATAASVPTNWWFALYTGGGTLVGQTADQLTAAMAGSTLLTLTLATAARATGVMYAAIMVKASTVPTLMGRTVALAVASGAILGSPVLAQRSGASLTTTAPGTIATPTTLATIPFCILS